MGKNLLTVETLVPDRDFIEIVRDGRTVKVEVRSEGELSLTEIGRVSRTARAVAPGLKPEASEEEMANVEKFADEMLKTILVEPAGESMAELLNKLTSSQKFAIVQVFTEVGARRRKERASTEQKSTGDESSLDSGGTTEVH